MAPLQGHTLGQRQKYYNKLVREAIAKEQTDIPKINYDEDDIDNMMKIDMACSLRNMDYILDVFKCEDMLYVSRAINKSTWLITDPQYAHIINPKYLHRELFPEMNAKAVTKLMLQVRRYLKDEIRCKDFYKYFNESHPKTALHWLQNCSFKFIDTVFSKRAYEIPLKLLKRLLRRSIKILQMFIVNYRKSAPDYWNKSHYFIYQEVLFLLKTHTDDFLEILENNAMCSNMYVHFSAKETHFLMKKRPQRIMHKFHLYVGSIDLKTFVKYLERDKIMPFIIEQGMEYSYTDPFPMLSPFLEKAPRDIMLDFFKSIFGINRIDCVQNDNPKLSNESHDSSDESHDGSDISLSNEDNSTGDSESSINKSNNSHDPSVCEHKPENKMDQRSDIEKLFYEIEHRCRKYECSNIYRWYQFLPFDLAFLDIKKFILAQSSSKERHSLLDVLLTCASYDFEHVKTVLQFYHDNHINEPFIHKITFVNSLLMQHNTFRFDEPTWEILNSLFHSLEVYEESDNNVQKCLVAIIIYKVLHNQSIPEIVEDKFELETLINLKKRLTPSEQQNLFDYLFNLSLTKLLKQNLNTETGMHVAIELLKKVWKLIEDWKKEETHRQLVIDKIVEIGISNKASPWYKVIHRRKRRKQKVRRHYRGRPRMPKTILEPYINIPSLYKMMKSYRKELFENSLVLHACEDVCLNALKHDPGLLVRYESEIDALRCNDDVSLRRFLSKLRIYWSETLAIEWTGKSIENLRNFTGHRALVRGIMVLVPHKQIEGYLEAYIPEENKVQWDEVNEMNLSIQKHIAKNMHLARPQLSAEVVLWYAKGDYLQHALLSLNTIYYNLRSKDIRKYISILLKAPVSLRKHGIRLAFDKYTKEELINQLPVIWESSKNSSIRAILFKRTHDLLCKENKAMMIKKLWDIISSFLDTLHHEENKIIYKTLGNIKTVPVSVMKECYKKTYLFLKSLPPKVDLEHNLDKVISNASKFIEYLDSEFVELTLIGSVYDVMSAQDREYMDILSSYLYCSQDTHIQMRKFNNLLQPVIEKCVPKWTVNEEQNIKNGVHALLDYIGNYIKRFVFEKKMVMPVELLVTIQDAFIKGLVQKHGDYKIIAQWKLSVAYVKLLDEIQKSCQETYEQWEHIQDVSLEELAKICVQQFTADIKTFFPSIYLIYDDVLLIFFKNFQMSDSFVADVLYKMLQSCEISEVYMLVLRVLSKYNSYYSNFGERVHYIKKHLYLFSSKEVTMHYFKYYDETFTKPITIPASEGIDNNDEASKHTLTTDSENSYSESINSECAQGTSENETSADSDSEEEENKIVN